jgi:hypothetical protein
MPVYLWARKNRLTYIPRPEDTVAATLEYVFEVAGKTQNGEK